MHIKTKIKWLRDEIVKVVRGKNPLETIVGSAILLIAAYFFVWGFLSARTSTISGYRLTANFANTGGLGKGADVSVSGVRIGSVSETVLRPDDYTVDMVLTIDNDFKFPKDTVAKISTNGLIGDKYITLEIGASKEFLAPDDAVRTSPFKPIEEMIGDFIFKEGK